MSKVSISTDVLKELVAKAANGVGKNKMLPLTMMVGVRKDEDVLTVSTTDGENYLTVSRSGIVGDEFNVTVMAERFVGLVSRLTCDVVTLSVEEDCLAIVGGSGRYKIEYCVDADGGMVAFPTPAAGMDETSVVAFDATVIHRILTSVKPSLAVDADDYPQYINYYFDANRVYATDRYKIAELTLDTPLFDAPVLISPQTMQLLKMIPPMETVERICTDTAVCFRTGFPDAITVYCGLIDGADEFAIDAIRGCVNTTLDVVGVCEFPRAQMLQTLDRIMCFVEPYDKNAVTLDFTDQGIRVSSKLVSGYEEVPYVAYDGDAYVCTIDVRMLVSEIKAVVSDTVSLHYGKNTLKIVDDDVVMVLALMD